MPDPLFAKLKNNKRKRPSQPSVTNPHNKNASRRTAPSKRDAPPAKKPRKEAAVEEDDDDEEESEFDGIVGAFDDVDLEEPQPGEMDDAASGDEYDDETPAQKRLRLAKMYLDSVRKGIGRDMENADGEHVVGWDAADVDRETIESRLQKDVVSAIPSTARV